MAPSKSLRIIPQINSINNNHKNSPIAQPLACPQKMTFRQRRGQLILQSDATPYKDKLIYFEGTNLLGRNPTKTTLTIKDRSISEIHAKIICKNGSIKVVDLKSKNGVYLNNLDNPIEPDTEVQIDPKVDVVYFAQICGRFVRDQGKPAEEETLGFTIQSLKKAVNKPDKQQKEKQEFHYKQKSKASTETTARTQQNNLNKSKEIKKTKKAEDDEKQKEKERVQEELLKIIIAEEETTNGPEKEEKAGKELEKEKEKVQEKKSKPKIKKESKEKNAKKSVDKDQKPQSKQKENEKQKQKSKSNIEKELPLPPSLLNKASKRDTSSQTAMKKQQKQKQKPRESKPPNEKKQKRTESAETKVKDKGAGKKKSKSLNPNEPNPKSKVVANRKKHGQPLNESLCSHPRRSIIEKTALTSGFSLTFKPTIKLTITENWRDKFDILVMEKYTRTFKLLYAICLGIPVVSLAWVVECEYRRGFAGVDVERFLLQGQGDRQGIGRAIGLVREGWKVFRDLRFYLVESEAGFHLPVQQIQALVEAGGGSVIKKITKKQENSKDIIFIVRNDYNIQDLKLLKKLDPPSDKIYTIELILDSCLHQQIKWAQNKVKKP